jgi:hypothetical protein
LYIAVVTNYYLFDFSENEFRGNKLAALEALHWVLKESPMV